MRFCEMALASCVPGAAALSLQERGLGLPVLPAMQGRGSRSPGGGDVQKQHLLAPALPARMACDGDKCSGRHYPPPVADTAVTYTRLGFPESNSVYVRSEINSSYTITS